MKNYILLALVLTHSLNLYTQELELSYYLPKSNSYNQDIPKPSEIIGHEVGEWHVTHDKLVQYMYAVANSSERIIIEETGKTYETVSYTHLTLPTT